MGRPRSRTEWDLRQLLNREQQVSRSTPSLSRLGVQVVAVETTRGVLCCFCCSLYSTNNRNNTRFSSGFWQQPARNHSSLCHTKAGATGSSRLVFSRHCDPVINVNTGGTFNVKNWQNLHHRLFLNI